MGSLPAVLPALLAPLALVALRDVRLAQLLRVYIDGIPLDLASALLPATSRLKPTLAAHIHWHARAQDALRVRRRCHVAYQTLQQTCSLEALIDSLRSAAHGTDLATKVIRMAGVLWSELLQRRGRRAQELHCATVHWADRARHRMGPRGQYGRLEPHSSRSGSVHGCPGCGRCGGRGQLQQVRREWRAGPAPVSHGY